MSEVNFVVYGGAHHGQRWEPYAGMSLLRLPKPLRSVGDGNGPTYQQDRMAEYRLATFMSGPAGDVFRVWVPVALPDGAEMKHVLELAARTGGP